MYVLSLHTFEVVRMVVIIRLYMDVFVGGLSVRTVTMLHVKVVRMVVMEAWF